MRRHREPELMDEPELDAGAHRAALNSLRRVNRWLGVDRKLVRAVRHTAPRGHLRVLEIGAGGGGWLSAAAIADRSNGRNWSLLGLDRSPFALSEARSHLHGLSAGQFIAGDALALPLATESVDVTVCSLLLHHFDPPEAVTLLREAARAARYAVVIGDLNRSHLAWGLTWIVTRLSSRAYVFHADGPRSVQAAYRPSEVRELVAEAGLSGARLRRVFPFRWILTWTKGS
jgi:ubiquinone/menaquinone biosynthesis C-methylase UbiE